MRAGNANAEVFHRVQFFKGVLGTRLESRELKIGSVQVHTGYLILSFKKNYSSHAILPHFSMRDGNSSFRYNQFYKVKIFF